MSTIGQINNLSLLNHQNQALSVCDNHSQKILQEIGSTVNELISSSTKFKEIFDAATQGVTTPYDIHFSENEIRINGEITSLKGIQDQTIEKGTKDLLIRINKIYDECHSSTPVAPPSFQPQQQIPNPMMMPVYPSMYPQMHYGFYPQCPPMPPHIPHYPMFTQQQPVHSHPACRSSSSCCHQNSDSVAEVRSKVVSAKPSEISTPNFVTTDCQTDDDDSALESDTGRFSPHNSSRHLSTQSSTDCHTISTGPAYQISATHTNSDDPKNDKNVKPAVVVAKDVSTDTHDLDDKVLINSECVSESYSSEEHDETLEGAIELFTSIRRCVHELKSSNRPDHKKEMRRSLAEKLIKNASGIASSLFFEMYLIGEKKRKDLDEQAEETSQQNYKIGSDLFINDHDKINDDDRELAIERLIMKQLANELAQAHLSQEDHRQLLAAYQELPQQAREKIEGHLWEVEGGKIDAPVDFGAQGMQDIEGRLTSPGNQAEAIRNYLDKQLAL